MSYHRAKQQKQAELYLRQREAEQRVDPATARDQAQLSRSRAWLEEYHAASGRAVQLTADKPEDPA